VGVRAPHVYCKKFKTFSALTLCDCAVWEFLTDCEQKWREKTSNEMFIGQIKYLEAGRCSHLKYLEAGRCQIKYLEAGLSQIKYLEAGRCQIKYLEAGLSQIKYLEAGRCQIKYLEAGRCSHLKYLEAGLSQIKYLEAGLSLNTYYYVLTMNAYKSRIYLCILSSFMDGHVQYYDSILTKKEGKGHK
jgi:hypothetical protein